MLWLYARTSLWEWEQVVVNYIEEIYKIYGRCHGNRFTIAIKSRDKWEREREREMEFEKLLVDHFRFASITVYQTVGKQ